MDLILFCSRLRDDDVFLVWFCWVVIGDWLWHDLGLQTQGFCS
ncbi:hypothetical protein LINPERHAP1_LOCUS14063, partial [Linum perenne]